MRNNKLHVKSIQLLKHRAIVLLYPASHIFCTFIYRISLYISNLCNWTNSECIEIEFSNQPGEQNVHALKLPKWVRNLNGWIVTALRGLPLMQFFCHRMKNSFKMISASAIALTDILVNREHSIEHWTALLFDNFYFDSTIFEKVNCNKKFLK